MRQLLPTTSWVWRRPCWRRSCRAAKSCHDSQHARWQPALLWAFAVFEHDMWSSERWLRSSETKGVGQRLRCASSAGQFHFELSPQGSCDMICGRLSELSPAVYFVLPSQCVWPRWNNSMMLGSSKVLLPCPKPAYRKHRKQLPLLTTQTLRAKHCFLKRSVTRQVKGKFKVCVVPLVSLLNLLLGRSGWQAIVFFDLVCSHNGN